MQIHELPSVAGSPTSTSELPIDDGTNTYAVTTQALGSSIVTELTYTLNSAAQTVKHAIDTIGANLSALLAKFYVNGDQNLQATTTIFVPDNNVNIGTSSRTTEARVNVTTSSRAGRLVASSSDLGIYDTTMSAWLIRANAAGNVYVPKPLYAANFDTSTRPLVQSNNGDNHHTAYVTTNAGQLAVNGQWGTSGYSTDTLSTDGSDARMKENIEDCERSGLDVINALRIRQFDWKSGRPHWDFGIVAQEAMEVDPTIVIGGDEETPYGINTLYVVDMLLKAVQELSAEVEELRNQ